MADLLGSFLGSDPEELARQAVANGRSDDLERFSSEVLRHLHLSRSSVPATAAAAASAVVDGLSTPAEAPAVPAVTPSYEGVGLRNVYINEMAGLSDEEEGERHEDEEDEEHSSKPAAAAALEYDDINEGGGNGWDDADSVVTVPKPTPTDDNGGQGDEEVAVPAPVQIAAARPTLIKTEPGAKFTINERVVVLAKNPALAARGRYEAAVLEVGPKTILSGRCRKSKFEYLVRYDGYGSDWDEWLPESSVEGRNDQTLKQVSVPTFEASVKKTPRSKSKDTAALTAADTGENSADGGGKVCELFGLYFGVHGGSLGLFRTCIFSYHYHSISHARNK